MGEECWQLLHFPLDVLQHHPLSFVSGFWVARSYPTTLKQRQKTTLLKFFLCSYEARGQTIVIFRCVLSVRWWEENRRQIWNMCERWFEGKHYFWLSVLENRRGIICCLCWVFSLCLPTCFHTERTATQGKNMSTSHQQSLQIKVHMCLYIKPALAVNTSCLDFVCSTHPQTNSILLKTYIFINVS